MTSTGEPMNDDSLAAWTEAKVREWWSAEDIELAWPDDVQKLAAWLDEQRRAAVADPETQAAMLEALGMVEAQGGGLVGQTTYLPPSVSDKGADTAVVVSAANPAVE